MKLFRPGLLSTLSVVFLAAAWKMIFIFWDVIPFNSDEAIVGLMARHILMGEQPVFFYGQAYMGSLDAFLVAAGFALFGQQVWVIRVVQLLLYLGTVATTSWIGQVAFRSQKVGLLAAGLLAIPTVNVTLYTTASLGGYGEALLLGNLILLVSLVVARRHLLVETARFPWLWLGLWGVLAGCGLWANGLTLVYSLPAGVYLIWVMVKNRRRWLGPFVLSAGLGFLLGALPWWIFALVNGPGQLLLELFGTAVAVEPEPWLLRTANHMVNFLLLGLSVIFGFRAPWSVQWLGLPLIPLVLAFWIGCLFFFYRQSVRASQDRSAYLLLSGVCLTLLAGFLFTPFGVDPSGRYFLPLAIPLAMVAAHMILTVARRPWQLAALAGLVVGYQLWGTLQCALNFPPGLTTQFFEPTNIDHRADGELIQFLKENGETRGYSNYWVAYPLAFHSKEEILFVPRLPYHLDLRYTPRDDRYAPYTQAVEASQRVAFITTRNPRLDAYLRSEFLSLGISWQEKTIGDYQVYYRLSEVVRPQDIGLGDLRE